jgi:hypothetical protein
MFHPRRQIACPPKSGKQLTNLVERIFRIHPILSAYEIPPPTSFADAVKVSINQNHSPVIIIPDYA